MRVLITGASGFSGRHLCRLAVTKGAEVFGMARSGDFPAGVLGIEGDVTDRQDVVTALDRSRPDWIFHLAAALPAEATPTSDTLIAVNVQGTLNLLTSAADLAPERPRILITSSSAVYGDTSSTRTLGEDSTTAPLSVYGTSKLTQEVLSRQFGAGGLDVIRVRTFNLVGPGEPPSLVCGSFARQIARIEKRLQPPTLRTGALDTSRDFTDVRDAMVAYWAVMEQGEAGAVYNVCSGRGAQIRDVARCLAELSVVPDIEIVETAPQDDSARQIHRQVGDYSHLRETTGWMPAIPLSQSLQDLLTSWRQRV